MIDEQHDIQSTAYTQSGREARGFKGIEANLLAYRSRGVSVLGVPRMNDQEAYCDYLDDCVRGYPELFPAGIKKGYKLYGFCEESVKMPEVRIRRICLHKRDEQGRVQVFQVVPSPWLCQGCCPI